MIPDLMAFAEKELKRRIRAWVSEECVRLEESINEVLPGNHSAADAIMLAHLATATDGYTRTVHALEWEKRPRGGWQTAFAYLADVGSHIIVNFAVECRYDDHFQCLAILIDDSEPGVRTPAKLQKERAILALGFRVISFSINEIFASPDGCRVRIEAELFDMATGILEEAGVIAGSGTK